MTQTNRVHLRAEAAQMRNGALVLRGDPFTAPSEEAADLVALHFASVVDHSVDEVVKEEEAIPPSEQTYGTKVLEAGKRKPTMPPNKSPTKPAKKQPWKSSYGRRDMSAEGED